MPNGHPAASHGMDRVNGDGKNWYLKNAAIKPDATDVASPRRIQAQQDAHVASLDTRTAQELADQGAGGYKDIANQRKQKSDSLLRVAQETR